MHKRPEEGRKGGTTISEIGLWVGEMEVGQFVLHKKSRLVMTNGMGADLRTVP